MRYLSLTRFHPTRGPEVIINEPELENEWIKEQLTKSLDMFEDTGFFTQQYKEEGSLWDTANIYFEVPDPESRGGVEMALLSLILENEQHFPSGLFIQFLHQLTEEISQMLHFSNFLAGKMSNENEIQLIDQVINIFSDWLKSLPAFYYMSASDESLKLLIFGNKGVGKNTIIKYFRRGRFVPTSASLSKTLIKALIERLSVISVNLYEKDRFNDSWKEWIKEPDILILVLDSTDIDSINQLKIHVKSIFDNYPSIPVVILANKSDLGKKKTLNQIVELLEVNIDEKRSISKFLTSAKTGAGLPEAFSNILDIQLTEDMIDITDESDLLLFMVRWDKNMGPVVVSHYPSPFPNNVNMDELAVKAFSTATTVFGSRSFEKNIISYTFIDYKLKSRLYFDKKGDDENEELYLIGIFGTESINEANMNKFEIELLKFMNKEFLKSDSDIISLFNSLLEIKTSENLNVGNLSVFSQDWAILFERKQEDKLELSWSFGNISDINHSLIANGIISANQQTTNQSIIIKFKNEGQRIDNSHEIMISSLENMYYLVSSNPHITARLLKLSGVDDDPKLDVVQSIITTQIISRYAYLYGIYPEKKLGYLDQIFNEAFFEMNIQPDQTIHVGEGECNLWGLKIPELLYMMWYVPSRMMADNVDDDQFFILIHKRKRLKFCYGIEKIKAKRICLKTSIVTTNFFDVMGFLPNSILVHDDKITKLSLFYDFRTNHSLITNHPELLIENKDFLLKLKRQRSIKKEIYMRLLKEPILLAYKEKIKDYKADKLIEINDNFI